ncbi:cell division protein FtsQ/DivIB [Pediococcus pentosaceus]|uniref:cell division protein FtsQ/DivIB n=1 Tax=Pediococcus pentosaceus TaxID=1255 RepID=UPI0018A18790|nr:cell division protein FtsQ/DivIB [Pediococcus pentosaceus]MBF7128627.1 FtsQ-type POTRA domain-containing protein [Pediococcus pentosaceus]MBF7133162.1 FtsQ-type POTRA domain-containing protein [Pediococcus pentosaceus]
MKKKKDEELTPWAKYQKEHNANSRSRFKRKRKATSKNPREPQASFRRNNRNKVKKSNKKGSKRIVKEQRLSRQKLGILIGSTLIVIALFFGYFYSSISRVQKFSVSGNKRVSTAKILKNVSIKKNDVILTSVFKEGKFENNLLKKNTDIKDATVSISWSGKVKIKVKENAVMGYVIRNKTYYTVKQDGSVVRKSVSQPSSDYPIFRNFQENSTLKKFLKEYAQMPNSVQNDVAEVDFSPTKNVKDRLHFFMNDGNQVYAIMSTFAKKMKYYPEISASMKERGMVDLQVGAFSRPSGWTDEAKAASESSKSAESSSKAKKQEKTTQNSESADSTGGSANSTETINSASSQSKEDLESSNAESTVNTQQDID